MSLTSLSLSDSEDFETFSDTLDSPSKPKMSVQGAINITSSAEKGSQTSLPIQGKDPAPAPKHKHTRFYFHDTNVTFLVKDTLYRVPKYFFHRDSSYFRTLFSQNPGKGSDSAAPIPLDGVDCGEFDALLSVIYPAHFHECELKTIEAWASVLRLSTEWSFSSIRTLAIERLLPIASPVDKVVLGRTYGIHAWLQPGFVALCNRPQPPTVDEAIRLGVRDTILITTVREGVYKNGCSTTHAVDSHLRLEENEAQTRKKIDDEVAAGKKAYEEAVKRKKVFEEVAAEKRAVEEAAAKRKALAEAEAKKQAEAAAQAKKQAEERCKRMAEEAAAKKKADEDAAAKKQVEKQAALEKWEDEYRRKMEQEAAARKKADEDAEARKKAEEEAVVKKWEEEYDKNIAEKAAVLQGGTAKKTTWGQWPSTLSVANAATWTTPLLTQTHNHQGPIQSQTQPVLPDTRRPTYGTDDKDIAAVSQPMVSEAYNDEEDGRSEEVKDVNSHVGVDDSDGADDCASQMGDVSKMSASHKKKLRKKAAAARKNGVS